MLSTEQLQQQLIAKTTEIERLSQQLVSLQTAIKDKSKLAPPTPFEGKVNSNVLTWLLTVEAYLVGCEQAADAMRQAGGFGEPQTWRFDWSRPYTTDEWLDVVPTFGGHSLLPADVQAELLSGIGAAVNAVGGLFTMDYATVAATATREPGASR